MNHFSLFTGIGGIDLAAEAAGFKSVGQCEIADYPTKILQKHWPAVPKWRDVKDVTRESVRSRGISDVTLLSGGFPCQPHSIAGLRKVHNDERELWPEFARVISEIRPKWVLAENVPGLLSSDNGKFFAGVLRDISRLGYNAAWCSIRASSVGAIHKRKRVFIIANTSSIDFERCNKEPAQKLERLPAKLYPGSIEEWSRRSTVYTPKLCRTNNGVPGQLDRLQALGNAVVPQQVYPILRVIAEMEQYDA